MKKINFMCLAILALASLFTSYASSVYATARDISTDAPGVPVRKVINHLTLADNTRDALITYGYRPGNNCFIGEAESSPTGERIFYLEVFSIPCGAETDNPSLSSNALAARILKLPVVSYEFINHLSLWANYDQYKFGGTYFVKSELFNSTTEDTAKLPTLFVNAPRFDINFKYVDAHINANGTLDQLKIK